MLIEPRCFARGCIHFKGVTPQDEETQVVICAAFPDGIPTEIAYGDVPHTEPYPNDNDIQYERA